MSKITAVIIIIGFSVIYFGAIWHSLTKGNGWIGLLGLIPVAMLITIGILTLLVEALTTLGL